MNDVKQLRILEVIQSLGKGGRTIRFVDTVNGLTYKKNYVIPLCFSEPEPWVNLEQLIVLQKKEGLNYSLIVKLIRLIKQHNINLIHAHCELSQFYAGLAGFITGVHVVGTFHRSDLSRYQPSLVNKAIKFLVCQYIAVSHDRLSLLTNNLNFTLKKCHVVHGGTVVNAPPTAAQIKHNKTLLNIPLTQTTLFSLGHLGYIKGHQDTIAALAEIVKSTHKVHLYIAGEGDSSEKNKLIQLTEKLNLQQHVTFLGQITNVQQWLCACDIFVQPSIEEAFGLVFIEAGAQAKPVVATNVGGIKEIIKNNTSGYLVAPSSPKALAAALLKLINDDDKRYKFGHYGYAIIKEHFSIEQMIDKYIMIFNQALSRA
jgi:glycosyltransferase involved in cell wall biosynthesis